MKNKIFVRKLIVLVLVFVLSISTAFAKDVFVDVKKGNDSNPGTLEEPFQTIQYATHEMAPGDVCYIKAGVYRETLMPKTNELTFRNFEDDYVLITGLDEVKGWVNHKENIWKASFIRATPPGSFKASMIFTNGKRMNWARFPNEDGDMFNHQDMSVIEVDADTLIAPNSRYLGKVIYNDLPVTTKNAWKGAYFVGVAAYNIGAWFTANKGRVKELNGRNVLSVEDISWNWDNGAKKGRFLGAGYGYLIGHMDALDVETEWHLQNDTLYFYPPKGIDMKMATIEARSRTLGLDLSGRNGITVQGINFKAAGVKMAGSVNCLIDGCTFRYASSFSGFSEHAWGDYKNGDGGIYVSGNNNIVKNCYIGQTWGNGIQMWGHHNTLENSILEHCNWQAERLANVVSPGDDNIIRGNTIRYGAREGIELGNDRWINKYARRALVQYNHVHDLGLLCPDGGLFYVNHQGGNKELANTEISYNIWHDYPNIENPRPHGGIYLDNMSSGYKIHHNVIWNVISGVHMNDISSDNNTHDVYVYNNTMVNCDYAVRMNQGKLGSMNTHDVIVQNNLSNGGAFEGIQVDNNRTDINDEEFIDASNHNYRLKSTSASVNAGIMISGINGDVVGGPDLGAYELNSLDWKAGAAIKVPVFLDEVRISKSRMDANRYIVGTLKAKRGELLFSDDFERDELGSEWIEHFEKTSIQNGVLVVNQLPNKHPSIARHEMSIQNAIFDFDFRFVEANRAVFVVNGKAHVFHVSFRETEAGLEVSIKDYSNGGSIATAISKQKKEGAWYAITLILINDQLEVIVNEKSIVELKSPGLKAEKTLFQLNGVGERMEYDNVNVWSIAP